MSNNDLIITKTLSMGESQCGDARNTAVLSSPRSERKSCSVGTESRQRDGRFRGSAAVTSPLGTHGEQGRVHQDAGLGLISMKLPLTPPTPSSQSEGGQRSNMKSCLL